MSGKLAVGCVFLVLVICLTNFGAVRSNPAMAIGYDKTDICIENCALCKKMLGVWFEGPLCAESCIRLKGKLIPDCEDFSSISPFLNNKVSG